MRTRPSLLPFLALLLVLYRPPVASCDDSAWTHYPSMNVVTSLAESETEVFVGTSGGIRRYDRFFEQWKAPITTADGLPANEIRALAYDTRSGELWIQTPAGSGSWHPQLESFSFGGGRPVTPSPPIRIPPVVPPYGYYLEGRRIIGPRFNYPVTAALIDSWNTLWIGTAGLGVGRAELSDEQLSFYRYGPIESNVTALAREGASLWIAGGDLYRTVSRGVSRFDTRTQEWDYIYPDSRARGFDDLRIHAVLPEGDQVWFSTDRALIRYYVVRQRWDRFELPGDHTGGIRAILRDGTRIWMGTESGLALFDTEVDSIRLVEGSRPYAIRSMAADSRDVWAATDWGLYRCQRGTATWTPVGNVQEITRQPMLAVTAGAGGVWAAVESPPRVLHVQPVSADSVDVAEVTMPSVWASRGVQIQADADRVWIGSDTGLLRMNRARREWKHFTEFDGMLGEEVGALLLEEEDLWVGTPEGLSRYRWTEDFFESTD